MDSKDREALHRSTGYLNMFDRLAFPGRPLKILAITEEPPPEGDPHFHFANTGDPQKDFYVVFTTGLHKFCEDVRAERAHHMLEWDDPARKLRPPIALYSYDEAVLSIAAHEVRHRVQNHLSHPLISLADTQKRPRCRAYCKRLMKYLVSLNLGDDLPTEFDSKFVDTFIAYEMRRGRASELDRLRMLILMTPETLPIIEAALTSY